jgi:hypothetical protein
MRINPCTQPPVRPRNRQEISCTYAWPVDYLSNTCASAPSKANLQGKTQTHANILVQATATGCGLHEYTGAATQQIYIYIYTYILFN